MEFTEHYPFHDTKYWDTGPKNQQARAGNFPIPRQALLPILNLVYSTLPSPESPRSGQPQMIHPNKQTTPPRTTPRHHANKDRENIRINGKMNGVRPL